MKPGRLEAILAKFYAKEQNIEISSFWDGEWTARIGDRTNGYSAISEICALHEVAEWFEERYRTLWPDG